VAQRRWTHARRAACLRRHGATVVTANRGDFDLLSREIGVQVLPV